MPESVRDVDLTFRLGEITLGSLSRRMLVASGSPLLNRVKPALAEPREALKSLPGVHGVLHRSLEVEGRQPLIDINRSWIRYVPRQYERFFIDLSMSYDEYLNTFSSKSRSTLRRKVRKFEKESGGAIDWKCYRTREEIEAFYPIARAVSSQTYQERLLNLGFPDDEQALDAMLRAAEEDGIRGYAIFFRREPVAYLYCPIREGVVSYSHLGYSQVRSELSPGTVLLWVAIEDLFKQARYRYFDFTEGGDRSAHSQKRLFSTGSIRCADVYVFRYGLVNAAIVLSHAGTEWLVEKVGALLEAGGVKRSIKRLVRRVSRWGAPSSSL